MFYAAIVISLLIVVSRKEIAPLFTGESQVQALFTLGIVFYSINFIPDAMQMTMQGIMKTLGKPIKAAQLCAFAQICIGLPISYLLGVHLDYGIPGLFLGLTVGNSLLIGLFTRDIYREDWNLVSSKIHENMHEMSSY